MHAYLQFIADGNVDDIVCKLILTQMTNSFIVLSFQMCLFFLAVCYFSKCWIILTVNPLCYMGSYLPAFLVKCNIILVFCNIMSEKSLIEIGSTYQLMLECCFV